MDLPTQPQHQIAIEQLKSTGVLLAIGEFGVSDPSIGALQKLPIDCLKLDGNFVQEMLTNKDGNALWQVINNAGQALGLRVVAEGVETSEQLVGLQALGCTTVQGQYFSGSLTSEEVLSLLSNTKWLVNKDKGNLSA